MKMNSKMLSEDIENNLKATDMPVSSEQVCLFDRVIEALMIGLLFFMPLALGVVHAWSEQVIIVFAGAMAFCLALKFAVRKEAKPVWTWAYIPMVLFVLAVVIQLASLGSRLVRIVSPNTAAMKTALLSDLPNMPEIRDSMTLSFYPWATGRELCLVLVVVTVFIVVVNVYRSEQQIKRLLGVIALVGGGIAVLALAGGLFGNGKIYWLIPSGHKVTYSGSFINHSHYGQFMNLSIGAAFGLLLVKLHEKFSRHRITPVAVTRSDKGGMRVVWLLTIMIIIGIASIFASLTRGGMISFLIAGAFTTIVLTRNRRPNGRNWIMAVIALGAFVCILYVGFEAVYDRLATLRDVDKYEDRWGVVKDLIPLACQFPLLGTGLGSLEMVYQIFDRSMSSKLMVHADNEYIQTIVEMGMIGMNLVVIFAVIVWYNYYRIVRHVRVPIRWAAFGLGFGVLAVMLHSFSDYGQHVPANACLSAVFCGLIINLARMGRGRQDVGVDNEPQVQVVVRGGWRLLRVGLLISVAAGWNWLLVGADKARRAESCWKQALQIENKLTAVKTDSGTDQTDHKWQGGSEEYAALIQYALKAVCYQPHNVKYRYWLNVYRWQSLSREDISSTEYNNVTAQIVADFHHSRALCATFGPTYCLTGQLEKYILGSPAGAKHIRQGYYLMGNDATACFTAALLDVEEGRFAESLRKFHRYLLLKGSFDDVIDVYVNQEDRPDLAVSAAGNDVRRLICLSTVLERSDKHRNLAETIQKKIIDLLKRQCEQSDVSAATLAYLARVYYKQEKYDLAIEYFRQAIALDYGRVQWRISLARMLAEVNRVPEAIHEAQVCLRLEPQMEAAKKLLASLAVIPNARTN